MKRFRRDTARRLRDLAIGRDDVPIMSQSIRRDPTLCQAFILSRS